MIFKKLHIRNIATIVDSEIRFDEDPLETSPLFLIYGPTGAGKTTILDSICLALYDAAPRLDILNQKKRQFEDPLANKGVRNVNDVSNLIRHGANEAFVELSFIGNDSRHYVATWSARFGLKGNAKGKLLDIDRMLLVEGSEQIWEKKTDIDKLIVSPEVVGLSYSNFLRTTLLPQGAFNRFLAAGKTEKAEILEKLAGLDRFSYLGQRITAKYKTIAQEKNKVENELKNLSVLSDESVGEHKETLHQLSLKVTERENHLIQAQAVINWIEKRNSLKQTVEAALSDTEKLSEIINSEDFISQKKVVEIRSLLAPLRTADEEIRTLEKTLNDNRNELHNIGRERRVLDHQYKIQSEEFIKLSNELLSQYLKRTSFMTFSNILNDAEKIRMLFDRYNKVTTNSNEVAKKIADLNKDLHEATSATEKLLSVKNKAEELESAVSKERQIIIHKISQLSLSQIITLKDKMIVWRNILAIEDLKERCLTLTNNVSEATKAYEVADLHYKKIELSSLEAAKSLRSRLSIGDRCHVCNSKVREIPTSEYFKDILIIAEEPRTEAKKQLDQAERERETVQLEIDAITEKIQSKGYNFPIERELQNSIQKEIEANLGEVQTLALVDNLLNRTAVLEVQREEFYNSLAKLDKELIELASETKEAQSKYSECQLYRDKLANQIITESDRQSQLNSESEELRETILHYFSWVDELDVNYLRNKLNYIVREWNEILKKETALRKNFNLVSSVLETIKSGLHETSAAGMPDVEINDEYNLSDIQGIVTELIKRYHVTSGRIFTAENLIKSAEEKRTIFIGSLSSELRSYLDDLTLGLSDDETTRLMQRNDEIQSQHREKKLIFDNAVTKLKEFEVTIPEMLKDRAELDLNTLKDDEIRLKQEITEINQHIGAINEILRQNDLKAESAKKLNERYKNICHQFDILNTLNSFFGEAHFRDVICEYILLHLLANANAYLSRFSNRYTMFTQPGNLEVMIHDSETGEDRVFSTLSGGETFMASLALALGLATLQNVSDTPDIFFIDEGFGSLSGDCLDSVMTTLDNLKNMESRRVGIVSHIEALRDRVSVRLALHKNGPTTYIEIESDS